MSVSETHVALVALLRHTGIATPGIAERIELDGPHQALSDALGGGTRLLPDDPAPLLEEARDAIARWQAAGIRLLTVMDDGYPPNLRTVHDRPALLFVAGDPALAAATEGIAVVGSRSPSAEGLAAAARLASEIVDAGRPVLSGLAAGIDAAAHRAAVTAGGRTVAVIGTGHEHAYPPDNAALQAELARDHAVICAEWPDAAPTAERFRRRNGLMSGLSRGTVIVEASARSGTRVQARLALAHGRPVFLAESVLRHSWAVELAGRPGVHVVDRGSDVLAVLARAGGPPRAPIE